MGCEVEKIRVPKNIGISPENIKKVAQELRDNREAIEAGWGSAMG